MVNQHIHSSLKDVTAWSHKLGLLPVPLYPNDNDGQHFVLLNGSKGNFCLDLEENNTPFENRNRAWSSDVGYYITFGEKSNSLKVYNWNRPSPKEYNVRDVQNDLIGFHRELEEKDGKTSQDIVNHVIRVFRNLRSQIDAIDGRTALNAFLFLIGSATANKNRDDFIYQDWGLTKEAYEISHSINSNAWDSLYEDLINENFINGLKPNLELMLRHAAGRVFQEAHYEAVYVSRKQLNLFGYFSEPVELKKQAAGIGLHFTPPSLARTLVEEAIAAFGDLPKNEIVIFDPACGSGEFLREMLRQLKINSYNGKVKLIGWDISQAACDMAKFVLAWESKTNVDQVEIVIECLDSLSNNSNWEVNANIIIMNPPFVSIQGMSVEQKQRIEEILGDMGKKRPDLSSAFIWKAAVNMLDNSVLASIIPASFLDSDSNQLLREELKEKLSTSLVARLGSHLLFSSAIVDAALYVAASKKNNTPPIAFWSDHRPSSNAEALRTLRKIRYSDRSHLPITESGFSIYEAPEIKNSSKTWAPRPFESRSLLIKINSEKIPTVDSLFDVKQGVRSGENKAFLISKSDWLDLPKTEQKYFRPAVINKSIKFGYLNDFTYVFFPYGKNLIKTEEDAKAKVKTYYNDILLKFKSKILTRSRKTEQNWWRLRDSTAWQHYPESKIVSTHFGDAGSFSLDTMGNFVVVQGYGWVLKSTQKLTDISGDLGLAYITILNSKLFSELISAVSNHVGGGQWDLSKRFVEGLPLPNLTSNEIGVDFITELAKYGKQIRAGIAVDESKSEELVKAIYNIDDNLK